MDTEGTGVPPVVPPTPGDNPPEAPSWRNQPWPPSGVGSITRPPPRPEAAVKRVFATLAFLLDASRRRRGGRMFLWTLVAGFAIVGASLLSIPVVTDLWANRIQHGLENEFPKEFTPAGKIAYRERNFKPGDALTRIVIPRLHLSWLVVEGTTGNALRAGIGHFPGSALPGSSSGNVVLAGHRTGFGEPFRHLERMSDGDKVELLTPLGRFTYEVIGPFDGHQNPWITNEADFSVIAATSEASLTLITCDPPGTSLHRLMLRARLISAS